MTGKHKCYCMLLLLCDSGKDKTRDTMKRLVIIMRETGEASGGGKVNKQNTKAL